VTRLLCWCGHRALAHVQDGMAVPDPPHIFCLDCWGGQDSIPPNGGKDEHPFAAQGREECARPDDPGCTHDPCLSGLT
jgi:hypothetical protein